MHVRMRGLGDRGKTQRRRYDTTIDMALRIALGRPIVDKSAIVNMGAQIAAQ